MSKNITLKQLCPEGIKQGQWNVGVDAVVSVLRAALVKGSNVQINGLGTFSIKNKAERKMKSFITKRFVIVPEHRAVSFKVSETLKADLKGVKSDD